MDLDIFNHLENPSLHLNQFSRVQVVELMLNHPSVDVNDKIRDGQTLLHFAVKIYDLDVVEVVLLEKFEKRSGYYNELVGDDKGNTALHVAAQELGGTGVYEEEDRIQAKAEMEIVKKLLNYASKDDINDQNDEGKTALHILAGALSDANFKYYYNWYIPYPDLQFFQEFLAAGADTTIKDNEGKTPLDYIELSDEYREVIDGILESLKKDESENSLKM